MRHARLLPLVLLALASVALAAAPDITGAWVFGDGQMTVRFEAKADGTFTQSIRSAEGVETYSGTYEVKDDLLTLTTEDGETIELRLKVMDDNKIQVTDEDGNGVEFEREPAGAAAEPGGALPVGGPGDLVPLTDLQPAAGGHIVFTRLVPVQLAGGGLNTTAPISKLFVMSGEGGDAQPFLVGDEVSNVKEPRWGPDYQRLAFTSDFHAERSALMSDCFVCPLGGAAVRITGNELKGESPTGYGVVTGLIIDNTQNTAGMTQPNAGIHITAQGALAISHPGEAPPAASQEVREALMRETNRFVIPHVVAGNQVWVKMWVNSSIGRVFTCQVQAGQVTDLGKVALNEATFLASKPSLTPDGRYCVAASVVNSVTAEARTTGSLDRTGGSAGITVYDIATGAPAAVVGGEQLGASSLVGPVVSPDGRFIACAAGQPTMEHLMLLDFASVMAGQPQAHLVVQGERVLPSAATMGRAWLVGCGSIAWSPDSRRLAFCRSMMSEDVTGDLFIVNVDGSGLTQLTQVQPNQMALNPSFSPDGTRIAFTLITGIGGTLKVERLMRRQYASDIYSIGLDGSPPQQLTSDGLSCEPAWGR